MFVSTQPLRPPVIRGDDETTERPRGFAQHDGVTLAALAALLLCSPLRGQSLRPFYSLDSLGLDPVLLHESGYFTNTREGHTVIQGLDGKWYYAELNELGNIVATDMPVGAVGKRGPAEQAFLSAAAEHLENRPEIRARLEPESRERAAAFETAGQLGKKARLTTGLRDILVLGIEFPDFKAPVEIGYVDSVMNVNTLDSESATGGFRDYFVENSYGRFVPMSHVYGWFEAAHSVSFYRDTLDRATAARLLVQEALSHAETSGVDFKIFDWDHDGSSEAVVVFTPVLISAHFSYLPGNTELKGISFSSYSIQDLCLGHAVHEYGHALGLRDLYEAPNPFGYYDVMASADWGNSPGQFSAYSKILLGWIDPFVVERPVTDLEIPNSHDHPFAAIVYQRNGTDCCYFVIENRVRKGYDYGGPGKISGSGLLIYHIHKYSKAWSHVEQADGRSDLEAYYLTPGKSGNFGDPGDFFPGTTGNTQFDADTNPSSRTASGKETGVSVTNISAPGEIMTIDVSFPIPTALDVDATAPGEFALYPNYPNPFNASTTIHYDLPEGDEVTLKIFDSLGREVATLDSGMKRAGPHRVRFDARSLPSGTYFCRLKAGDLSATRRLLLLK